MWNNMVLPHNVVARILFLLLILHSTQTKKKVLIANIFMRAKKLYSDFRVIDIHK